MQTRPGQPSSPDPRRQALPLRGRGPATTPREAPGFLSMISGAPAGVSPTSCTLRVGRPFFSSPVRICHFGVLAAWLSGPKTPPCFSQGLVHIGVLGPRAHISGFQAGDPVP